MSFSAPQLNKPHNCALDLAGAVEPMLVPPTHPLGGGQLDLLKVPPGASPADELGLVETDYGSRGSSSGARKPLPP